MFGRYRYLRLLGGGGQANAFLVVRIANDEEKASLEEEETQERQILEESSVYPES